jgi:hypothetical protein
LLKFIYLVPLFALVACGPTAVRRPPPAEPALPPAPPDAVVGDGVGRTQREAELDARRVVIEQLTARLTTRTEAVEREHNGLGDRKSSVEVTSEASFDHAELIETIGIVETDGGFRVRAALSRARAVPVYQQRVTQLDAARLAAQQAVEAARSSLDTAVLLKDAQAPGHLLARREAAARLLAALGAPVAPPPAADDPLPALRRRAVVRLEVTGGGELRPGVQDALARALAARGCTTTPRDAALEPDRPTADAHLTFQVVRRQERDLSWIDLELSLALVDARTGHRLATLGSPHYVHAGSLTQARAEDAALEQLAERLQHDLGQAPSDISCQ